MFISLKDIWKQWCSGKVYVVLAALAAQSINISVGLCQGYSAVMLPCLALDSLDITPEQSSWIASLGVISNPFGALLGGVLVDTVGRRATLQSIAIPGLLGWITISMSDTYTMLCIGRFITGFTIGMSTATYIYVAEISTPDIRGILAGVGPALVSLGIFLVYVLGSYLHWKTVATICAAMSIITPILMQFAPESPLWLASKGRVQDAYEAMNWLRQDVKVAQDEINDLFKIENTHVNDTIKNKMRAVCRWSVFKPFLILLTFFMFQELSGIYIILYYAVDFFEGVGTSIDAFTASMIVGGLRVVMGVIGACLINHVRRKILATSSGILLSVTMFLAGASNYFGGSPTLRLVCILGHVCASMIGFLQLPWIMTGELYAQKIRGIMSGATTCCAYILIFINIKTYPYLVDLISINGSLFLFGGCAILGAIFCVVFLPETKGKSLSEITLGFEDKKDDKDNTIDDKQITNVSRKNSAPPMVINITEAKTIKRKVSV